VSVSLLSASAVGLHNHRGRNLDSDRPVQYSQPAVLKHRLPPVPRRFVALRLPDDRRLHTDCGRRRCHGDGISRLLRRIASQPVDAMHGASVAIGY